VPELSFLSRLRARRAKNQWFGWRCAWKVGVETWILMILLLDIWVWINTYY
jgi:hypothetical protein